MIAYVSLFAWVEAEPSVPLLNLQKKLMESLVAADRWRSAFKEIATLSGFSFGMGREPDIPSVVDAVQRTRASEQAVQVCMGRQDVGEHGLGML